MDDQPTRHPISHNPDLEEIFALLEKILPLIRAILAAILEHSKP